TESGPRPDGVPGRRGGQQESVPRERPQRHRHPHVAEVVELSDEVRETVVPLPRRGPVSRRAASVDGPDVEMPQSEPIIPVHRSGLAGEAGPVQGREQELARPVTGEDPPRAVPPVSGRREAHDQDASRGITEPRYWTGPVL